MTARRLLTLATALLLPCAAVAQTSLAPTPPMGWNSWDSYGLTITEAQFRANVEVMAKRLKPFGWKYAVIDEGWYLQNPEAASKPATLKYTRNVVGQFEPAPNRFPSASNGAGLKAVADFVHEQGLSFGVHIIRGIPKQTVTANLPIPGSKLHTREAADIRDVCSWNPDNYGVRENAAGQAWYDALMSQYAHWGVDYIKVDCIASHPYKAGEIRMIHKAIAKTNRPMVLSLSPGPTALENAAEVAANAQLWRISNDIWDLWDKNNGKDFPRTVKSQFPVLESWIGKGGPGHWPDADMLPLGKLDPVPGWGKPRSSQLSPDEAQTMLTLWSISRSPLFMGGNLTELDDATAALLTNPEVIAVDQEATEQKIVAKDGDVVTWIAQGAAGQNYLALFNLGDQPVQVKQPFGHYGLPYELYNIRDLWAHKLDEHSAGVIRTLPPHGSALLELKP